MKQTGFVFSIGILVIIAFGRAFFQGFASIDDNLLVTGNIAIQGLTWENIRYVFTHFDPELYIPLTFLSFQMDYTLFGLNPFGFHLTNIILHIINAFLAFIIMQRFFDWRFAAFGGALFAIHPLHTEAVVWIAGRKDVLFACFFFLSFYLYLSKKKSLSFFVFILAILSKVTAAVLPVILVLHDCLIERKKFGWAVFKDKIFVFAVSGVFIGISIFGKERVLASSGVFETVLMAAKSTMFYLQKLFIPVNLSVFYPYHSEIVLVKPEFWIPILLCGALCVIFFWYRNRNPLLSFGLSFFLITLAPTFLNFSKGEAIFFAVDRYAYVPSVGVIIVLMTIISGYDRGLIKRFHALIFGTIVIVILVTFSSRQTRVWDTAETLFKNALHLYPESVVARTDLARVYREQGKITQAFELLKEGLLYGDSPYLRLSAGLIYAKIGQIADAREQFLKAGELAPDLPDVYYALGSLDEELNLYDQARSYYQKAIELDRSFVAARVRIARLYRREGENENAKKELEIGLKWNSSYIDANSEMAEILMEEGEENKARQYIENILKIDPTNSRARSLISQ